MAKNYMDAINAAADAGDYYTAATEEQNRNAYIDANRLPYEKTNLYSGNLDKHDYGLDLQKQMSSNMPSWMVADTYDARQQKTKYAKNLQQYANDDISQAANNYIANGMGGVQYADMSDSLKGLQAQYNDYLQKYVNSSYADYLNSDSYGQLAQKYQTEGQNAMQNTTGALSARTGGIASSYAGTAASQAYNDYMTKLSDAAQSAYQNERSNMGSNLSALGNAYGTELGQYNTDRQLTSSDYWNNLNSYMTYDQNQKTNDYNNRYFAWQQSEATQNRQDNRDDTAYNRTYQEKQDAQALEDSKRSNAVSMYLQMMQYGTAPSAAAINRMLGTDFTDAQLQQAASNSFRSQSKYF